jgi:hypothetical protein
MSWEDIELEDIGLDTTPVPSVPPVPEKPKILLYDDPEYVTIYCGSHKTGNGRMAKTAVGCMMYSGTPQAEAEAPQTVHTLVSQNSKYIGTGIPPKQASLVALTHGLQLARSSKLKKVAIYTDFVTPVEKYISSINYFSEDYETEFKRVLEIFDECKFINIPRKFNISIGVAIEELKREKLYGKQRSKQAADQRANDLAFKNRFK